MFFASYTCIVLGVAGIFAGGVLLARQYRNSRALFLSLTIMSAGTWAFANGSADLAAHEASVILWSGVAMISFNFLASFFICFVSAFVRHGARMPRWQYALACAPSVALGFFAFSAWSIREAMVLTGEPAQILPGPLYIVGPVFLYAAFTFSYVLIARRYRHGLSRREQLQARYIVLGSAVTLVGLTVFDILLPLAGELRFFSIGPLTTVFLIACAGYAVFRHDLADITSLVQRSLAYSALFALAAGLYTGLLLVARMIFTPDSSPATLLSAGITILVGISSAPYLERAFRRFYERVVLHEQVLAHAAELELRVRERTAEVVGLQERQGQMLVDLAHGVQTPLTIMQNELEYVALQLPDKKKADAIRRALGGLSRFVYDLLRVARIEQVGSSAAERVNITELLQEILEYLGVLAATDGVTINAALADDVSVLGDRRQLEEAFTNIFSNAFKYMRTSSVRVLDVRLAMDDSTATLSVQDTGSGIPADKLAHVFEKFYRVGAAGDAESEGTGLGLAIAKAIIETHGGAIRAESSVGNGTAMIVTLPLQAASGDPYKDASREP